MSQVALNFSKLGIPEKVAAAREIFKQMAGNANFPTPLPTLVDCVKITDALDTAYQAALDGGKSFKTKQKEAEKKFDATMSQLASYVQTASSGDLTIIISSGMGVKKTPGPEEKMPPPQGLKCLHSDVPTEAPLKWKPVKKAKSYMIQLTDKDPDSETDWKQAGISTKASFTATGLLPLTQYWFRVAAVGPLGISGWSDPAKRMLG